MNFTWSGGSSSGFLKFKLFNGENSGESRDFEERGGGGAIVSTKNFRKWIWFLLFFDHNFLGGQLLERVTGVRYF